LGHHMLTLEAALDRILAAVPPTLEERVALGHAHGRILTQGVTALIDLPPFDNSAMDGYAVRAIDLATASTTSPVRLKTLARIAAGDNLDIEVKAGTCARLFTGSALPDGADAVVMQEDTRPIEGGDVWILEPVKPWENIRFQGEDVKRGAVLAQPGEKLTAGGIGLLAATGHADVVVGRRPVVGLMATGSELREAGQALAHGQIYESNRAGLAALASQAGATAANFPLVPDTLTATRSALEEAFGRCDVVVSSGGVSVGEMDFVKDAFGALGGELEFWKVAIKPGRPFVFGRRQGKLFFGLPGNPVSALVTFLLLVRPALLRWQGAAHVGLPAYPGILAEPLSNDGERRHFLRVTVDAAGKVRSAGVQASHVLSAIARANGLIDLPPKSTLTVGATVQVLRWE
jgi:molybdopterin molybdotransferase